MSTLPADRRHRAVTLIRAHALIAIVRAATAEEAERRSAALIAGGVRVLEVSLTTPGAAGVVERLVPSMEHVGGSVGLGTVLTAADVDAAARGGASFVVSPLLDRDMVRAAHMRGLAVVAGGFTPAELVSCLAAGADFVKLFPASATSPSTVRTLLEALGQLPLVPTGGVAVEDGPSWLRAGAVAVGLGGGLSSLSPEDLAAVLAELRTARDERASPGSDQVPSSRAQSQG